MGCDIHGFIEYQYAGDHWGTFAGNLGSRDYAMFGILAGVRDPDHQLFEPKGLPEGKLSWEVEGYMTVRIDDKHAADGVEGYCSLESAKSWGNPIEYATGGKPWRTDNPDLHSHSWLTYLELAEAIAHYMFNASDQGPYSVEWDAVLAAMKAFEDRGVTTRFTFCFDN